MNHSIYIQLLDEGTPTWRLIPSAQISANVFIVGGFHMYDPETEHWEFPPGTCVIVEPQEHHGARLLTAISDKVPSLKRADVVFAVASSDRLPWGISNLDAISPEHRTFLCVYWSENEINSGGFESLLSGSCAETVPYLVDALTQINALATASICAHALKSSSPDELDQLGQEFFSKPDDLTNLLFEFITKHPDQFGTFPKCT